MAGNATQLKDTLASYIPFQNFAKMLDQKFVDHIFTQDRLFAWI